MKTKTYLQLFLAIVAISLVSCDKDQPNNLNQSDQYQLTAGDQAVTNRILKFRQKLAYKKAHPNYKSGELVNVDSARWDVETNLNTTYAFPDGKYLRTHIDSALLYMPAVDTMLTTEDGMLALYEQCYAKAVEVFQNCPYAEKNLLFVSLKKGEMLNNEYAVTIKVMMGEVMSSGYTYNPFGPEDDWVYGNLLGKCNGSMYLESDAAKQLEFQLNNNRPIYMPGPGYRIVYTLDPESPYTLVGSEYTNSNGQYLMFYMEKFGDFTDDEKCLDDGEMNMHYNGECEVIYDRMQITYNKPNNWEFMNCVIDGKHENIGPQNQQRIRHENNKLYYSYRHVVKLEYIPNAIVISD
jgi:hypothetical protein